MARKVMYTRLIQMSPTFILTGSCIVILILSACGVAPVAQPAVPTLSLDETWAKERVIHDFEAVHAPTGGDENRYLILGELPVSKPTAVLSDELAVFLGRWEGYSYSPPIKKDRKVVLVIQEITLQGGIGFAWWGTNLQYPDMIEEIHFRVVRDEVPSIEWQIVSPGGRKEIYIFTYDREKDLLRGWSRFADSNGTSGPYDLHQTASFQIYKDYPKYLNSKRIYPREYRNQDLQQYGKGYMLYLPEGYETDPDKSWPLLFFLHGSGDRGDNLFVVAQNSPFMMIREKGPLPFIVVAPLLNTNYTLFPVEYMDGAIDEILAEYRVDQRQIYLTGMSMGGEATYRFALHRPDLFTAIAPLCAFMTTSPPARIGGIKGLPVWAIHGADDRIISFIWGQQAADALEKAGADVRFTVLEGYDHDVWTDTYSDPQFYDWFLQYDKP